LQLLFFSAVHTLKRNFLHKKVDQAQRAKIENKTTAMSSSPAKLLLMSIYADHCLKHNRKKELLKLLPNSSTLMAHWASSKSMVLSCFFLFNKLLS